MGQPRLKTGVAELQPPGAEGGLKAMEEGKPDSTNGLGRITHGIKSASRIERTEAIGFLAAWQAAKRKSPAEGLKRKIDLLDPGEPFGFGVVEQFEIAVINVHPAAARVFEQEHAFPGGGAALVARACDPEHASRIINPLQGNAIGLVVTDHMVRITIHRTPKVHRWHIREARVSAVK